MYARVHCRCRTLGGRCGTGRPMTAPSRPAPNAQQQGCPTTPAAHEGAVEFLRGQIRRALEHVESALRRFERGFGIAPSFVCGSQHSKTWRTVKRKHVSLRPRIGACNGDAGISNACESVDDRARAESPGADRVARVFQIRLRELVEQAFRTRDIAINQVTGTKSYKDVLQAGLMAEVREKPLPLRARNFMQRTLRRDGRQAPRRRPCARDFRLSAALPRQLKGAFAVEASRALSFPTFRVLAQVRDIPLIVSAIEPQRSARSKRRQRAMRNRTL